MPSYASWKAAADETAIAEELDRPRFVVLHRPILLHRRRSEKGPICDCGCGDRWVYVAERREHITLLVDLETGERKLRHRVKDKAAFDELASQAKAVHAPLRLYEKQLRLLLDRRPKVVFASGGSRAGKTQFLAEALFDEWCLLGGRGAVFFWVSYSLKQTRIAVQKLVDGFRPGKRFQPPIIPPELIVSYPANVHATDQAIVLADGSRIELKHAGKGTGGHLQGDNALAVAIDEWGKWNHEEPFTILLSRLRDGGGRMIAASTPETPHWSEKYLSAASTFEQAAQMVANGEEYPVTVKEHLTCFDNVWQDPKIIEDEIKAHGGPDSPIVQRQVFGRAVPNSGRLWRCFDESRHLVEFTHRNVSRYYDYQDITPQVAGYLFDDLDTSTVLHLGGLDFNKDPHSLVIARILVPKGVDPYENPNSWILYFEDNIIKRNVRTTTEFADFVNEKACTWRRLRKGYFKNTPTVCDATGFLTGQRGQPLHWTPDAIRMEERGFPVRPPEYHKGKPRPCGRQASCDFLNELMQNDRVLIHAGRCKEFIESLKTELDQGNGTALKRSSTLADRRSGVTDAARYLAWAALYRADEIAEAIRPAPAHLQSVGHW